MRIVLLGPGAPLCGVGTTFPRRAGPSLVSCANRPHPGKTRAASTPNTISRSRPPAATTNAPRGVTFRRAPRPLARSLTLHEPRPVTRTASVLDGRAQRPAARSLQPSTWWAQADPFDCCASDGLQEFFCLFVPSLRPFAFRWLCARLPVRSALRAGDSPRGREEPLRTPTRGNGVRR
jgi:hypothetical protein